MPARKKGKQEKEIFLERADQKRHVHRERALLDTFKSDASLQAQACSDSRTRGKTINLQRASLRQRGPVHAHEDSKGSFREGRGRQVPATDRRMPDALGIESSRGLPFFYSSANGLVRSSALLWSFLGKRASFSPIFLSVPVHTSFRVVFLCRSSSGLIFFPLHTQEGGEARSFYMPPPPTRVSSSISVAELLLRGVWRSAPILSDRFSRTEEETHWSLL